MSSGDRVVAAAYDAVASAYDVELRDELDAKPLDRALLTAFAELAAAGPVADLGCGPGQVTGFLAARHPDVTGLDLSSRMIDIARQRWPQLPFRVGSMLALPVAEAAWAGAVAFYSIIHLTPAERSQACAQFARAIRREGWLLVAFHVESPEFAAGQVSHLSTWFGQPVDLDFFFLDPADVVRDLESAGFVIRSSTIRDPAGPEYPSRRCYLLAQRL